MTPVTYPYISETFKRALHEVISPYVGTGGWLSFGSYNLLLYRCDLGYQVEKVTQPSLYPRITFTGTRSSNERLFKCEDDQRRLIDVKRLDLTRTVYVSVPKSLSLNTPPFPTPAVMKPSSYEIVDAVWGQLLATVDSQAGGFRDRGITNVRLTATPIEMTDTDYWIGRGTLTATVEATSPRP